LAENETDLEQHAGGFLRSIKTSKLTREMKQALKEGFLSWLIQRLPIRTRQEIQGMLIGELPELVETRAGQDLIEIGVERGLAESVGIVLEAKRGRLSKSLRQRIRKLQHDQLRQLLVTAAMWESIEPLDAWLTEHDQ
jgi:hypothetical protein